MTKPANDESRPPRFITAEYIYANNIANNYPTLQRMIEEEGFPAPIKTSSHRRLWPLSEVDAWLESRRSKAPPAAE